MERRECRASLSKCRYLANQTVVLRIGRWRAPTTRKRTRRNPATPVRELARHVLTASRGL